MYLKWYYDDNRIFPIAAILEYKKEPMWEEKCCLLYSNISFCSRDIEVLKICKLVQWWCHTLNQIFIKYDEKRYLSQFVSDRFDSLHKDPTKCASQYECNMETHWVPDFPNI